VAKAAVARRLAVGAAAGAGAGLAFSLLSRFTGGT
jgi:hypothetical protein